MRRRAHNLRCFSMTENEHKYSIFDEPILVDGKDVRFKRHNRTGLKTPRDPESESA